MTADDAIRNVQIYTDKHWEEINGELQKILTKINDAFIIGKNSISHAPEEYITILMKLLEEKGFTINTYIGYSKSSLIVSW